MRQDVTVTTSYTSGLTINMEQVSMKLFLTSIATSTILQCREIKLIKDPFNCNCVVKLPHYNNLMEEYCSGVPHAVILSMLDQNAEILFQFVRDCVENDTKRGLYLFVERSRQGVPGWKIILQALDEYTHFLERMCDVKGIKRESHIYYNSYNEKFEKLMSKR